MISLKETLKKLIYPSDIKFSFREKFAAHPDSLRQAIYSMIRSIDAPQSWKPVSDIFRDDYWTDEVQGIAWDGENWIFSCNANQAKPLGVNEKAIYVFKGGQPIGDDKWICRINYKDIPHPLVMFPNVQIFPDYNHYGQVTCYNGHVYVEHHFEKGPKKNHTYVIVFRNDGGILQYDKWIELEEVTTQDPNYPNDQSKYITFFPQFQAIIPWDGYIYTCPWSLNNEFYIHYLEDHPDGKWRAGQWTRNTLKFSGGKEKAWHIDDDSDTRVLVDLPSKVQGACFSPNGHLYISCEVRLVDDTRYKAIAYFSSVSGHLMGIIPVLAEEDGQEIEGICFGETSWLDGRKAQIHAILLENRDAALDNIFFKSFLADHPEIV
jgi:hypothetical protein